ncbi:conserved hypothetical protein [Leishmania major strain Friedlin]|uniref:Uncharacterized protein n=1 Tax=Leishmania major TaxID=5664 RepID=Q4QFU6_LEIMA|nr:conserved hypothetical protein [Leishmania major strain Friedlin]CAG9571222.1 hypothetical_protein_-_conserved [Leishmania major strain Friedlin]CAJ02789.1 conserved hypothetical protein [Leishmania major strain Friedlin]|eukprot:XP_001687638.1 conserved hypothetical protein [Leishmania major strain Friedlin]
MGLLGKERAGSFKATDNSGRRFLWTIDNFSQFPLDITLDSDNVTCFTKVKFHLHLTLRPCGAVGIYIHYKKPPIPKYSYYLTNSKCEGTRQHTAHSLPDGAERCGHWNVCSHTDVKEFLGEDDKLLVHFCFDDDTLVVNQLGQSDISVTWSIPKLKMQNLCPYSSRGFFVGDALLVARLDIKPKDGHTGLKCAQNNVATYIIFVFCRKGNVPPHSIELVDSSGNAYFQVAKNEDEPALTALVDRSVVEKNVGSAGSLLIRINFSTSGNPLDLLNTLNGLGSTEGERKGSTGDGRSVELDE